MAIIKINNNAIDLDAAEIPNLDAAKITTGQFADAKIADVASSKITGTITPSDTTVTTAKIVDANVTLDKLSATGTKDATTFLRGDNTFASAGGANTPAFFVKRSSNQLVVPSTITLVQFNSEDVDTDNCFDSTTNYRFTPTVSGKYFLEAFQYSTFGGTAPANEYVRIRKNGADIAESSSRGASHGYGSLSVATIASANGSTDYFDVTIYGDVGGGGDYYAVGDSPIAKSSFKGFKIIE